MIPGFLKHICKNGMWRGSNVSFFATLCCYCLDLKALHFHSLKFFACLPSRRKSEAIRAQFSSREIIGALQKIWQGGCHPKKYSRHSVTGRVR